MPYLSVGVPIASISPSDLSNTIGEEERLLQRYKQVRKSLVYRYTSTITNSFLIFIVHH